MRTLLILAAIGAAAMCGQRATAQDVVGFIRNDQWAEADAAAAQYPDPVARKIVSYFRMLAPNGATADEIAAFLTDSPDWPSQAQLERRRDEALATEPDDATATRLCTKYPPKLPGTALRCANAFAAGGNTAQAGVAARQAWVDGITDKAQEPAFLQRWGGVVTADDQWLRFDHLAWAGQTAPAERQLTRLDPSPRRAAETRLALRRDAPDAEARYAALSPTQRDEAPMVLERARYLRRAGQDAEALALWNSAGAAAQRAAPADRLPAYWAERSQLLRRMLREGDARGAYQLASDHGQHEGEGLVDAEFIAGYLALRRLNDPASAAKHFRALAGASKAAITQGRAHYWLGRAAAAAKQDPAPEFTTAAQWSTTFYGQLAALALGEAPDQLNARIVALRDPGWTREQVLGFAEREVTRATVTLAAWGELRRSHVFALRLDEIAPDPADRSLAARLALGLGETDQAVMIARRAGRDGLMLPESGWPVPFDPPAQTIEPALVLGIIRQESNFDTEALSPSGARGLMQLMPTTAKTVAKLVGEPTSIGALTADPDHNMRLGSAYLGSLLNSFAGSMPLAIAAYNAGPGRVEEWIGTNGDPRQGSQGQGGQGQGSRDQAGLDAMLDWLELIPFNETRNYVQRVIENVVVYRARLQRLHGGPAELPPIAP